jgi:hypothetical protein
VLALPPAAPTPMLSRIIVVRPVVTRIVLVRFQPEQPAVAVCKAPSANQQPTINQPIQNHDDQPPMAKVAGANIRQTKTTAQTGHANRVEAATVAANPAETKAAIHPHLQRRQPAGLPHPVAPMIVPEPITTQTKGSSVKPILRYQSQLLFRRSLQPKRILRIRPTKLKFIFRPARFGVKPEIDLHECKTY